MIYKDLTGKTIIQRRVKMQESDGNVKRVRRISEGSGELKIYGDIKNSPPQIAEGSDLS